MDYINQYESLLSQEKDIKKQILEIEKKANEQVIQKKGLIKEIIKQMSEIGKNYVEQVMQKQGLSIGDLVTTPKGTKGFLKGFEVDTFGNNIVYMSVVDEDGSIFSDIVSLYCNFNELKLVDNV